MTNTEVVTNLEPIEEVFENLPVKLTKMQIYYIKNKESHAAKMSSKEKCHECGLEYSLGNKTSHFRSKKHFNALMDKKFKINEEKTKEINAKLLKYMNKFFKPENPDEAGYVLKKFKDIVLDL